MNRILILASFLTLFILSVNSQEKVGNFEIEGREIIWQKVFDSNLNNEEIIEKIKDSGTIENLSFGENKVSGDLKPMEADFRGAGYSEIGTPMIVYRSFINGFVIAEFKEGKYRITIKRIILTKKYDQGDKTSLEYYGLNRRNEFTNVFRKSAGEILDFTFSEKFNFAKIQNDTW
jgi:hypothetical protein